MVQECGLFWDPKRMGFPADSWIFLYQKRLRKFGSLDIWKFGSKVPKLVRGSLESLEAWIQTSKLSKLALLNVQNNDFFFS